MTRKRRPDTDRPSLEPVTTEQLDFCKRRIKFLMQDVDTKPMTFLLANAYHQGLSDCVEMYESGRSKPKWVRPEYDVSPEP